MNDRQEHDRHHHEFRPGPWRAPRTYWLEGQVLHWRIRGRSGQLPLDRIAALRLYLPPDGQALAAHCDLIETSGRRHRISDHHWARNPQEGSRFGRHQRRTQSFRRLTHNLARRLQRANPHARFLTGPSRAEWIASLLVALLAIAVILGGALLMIAHGALHLAAAAFMGMTALYLPMLWPVIRSGGPRPFDPQTLDDPGRP
jgi:hypothetical protein